MEQFVVETDRFLFRADGAPASPVEAGAFSSAVSDAFARNGENLAGVEVSTPYPHRVTIAFPALETPSTFTGLWDATFAALAEAAAGSGLTLTDGPTCEKASPSPSPDDPLGPALARLAWTRITVLAPGDDPCAMLPRLYPFEYLAHALFARPARLDALEGRFLGHAVHRQHAPADWPLVAYPADIPETGEDYQALVQGQPRDYGYIVPQPDGRLTFRGSLAQPSAAATLDLVALRLSSVYGTAGYARAMRRDADARLHFEAMCEGQRVNVALASTDLGAVTATSSVFSPEWQARMQGLLRQTSRFNG